MYIIINVTEGNGMPHMVNKKGSIFFTQSELEKFTIKIHNLINTDSMRDKVRKNPLCFFNKGQIRWNIINLNFTDEIILSKFKKNQYMEKIQKKLLEIRVILREKTINNILCM